MRCRAARVFSRIVGSRALNRRGVNARWAIARMRVCSGGTRADRPEYAVNPPSFMMRDASAPRSRTGAWAFSLENVSQSSNTARTSAQRVTTQRPMRSSYMTGSSRRRRSYAGNGSFMSKGS